MHKCETCPYKGEIYDVKFRPQHVCHKARNQVEAVLAYRAEECPFKNAQDVDVPTKDGGATDANSR